MERKSLFSDEDAISYRVEERISQMLSKMIVDNKIKIDPSIVKHNSDYDILSTKNIELVRDRFEVDYDPDAVRYYCDIKLKENIETILINLKLAKNAQDLRVFEP